MEQHVNMSSRVCGCCWSTHPLVRYRSTSPVWNKVWLHVYNGSHHYIRVLMLTAVWGMINVCSLLSQCSTAPPETLSCLTAKYFCRQTSLPDGTNNTDPKLYHCMSVYLNQPASPPTSISLSSISLSRIPCFLGRWWKLWGLFYRSCPCGLPNAVIRLSQDCEDNRAALAACVMCQRLFDSICLVGQLG